MTTAEEHYNLIMDRVCHVLRQRIRGEISYSSTLDNKGYAVIITNDQYMTTFTHEILYTDIEVNDDKINRCVLSLSDNVIGAYKNYIERNIVYKENSL